MQEKSSFPQGWRGVIAKGGYVQYGEMIADGREGAG
jgi:hypothetical protein